MRADEIPIGQIACFGHLNGQVAVVWGERVHKETVMQFLGLEPPEGMVYLATPVPMKPGCYIFWHAPPDTECAFLPLPQSMSMGGWADGSAA